MNFFSNFHSNKEEFKKKKSNQLNPMNETAYFLKKINKLNENKLNIQIKSRHTLIQFERERMASLRNKEKPLKNNKKEHIFKDLSSLFGRFRQLSDENEDEDSYAQNFYSNQTTKRNFLVVKNNSSHNLFNKKKANSTIKEYDNFLPDYSPKYSKNDIRKNIMMRAKNLSNSNSQSHKRFFNTELLDFSNKENEKKLVFPNEKSLLPSIGDRKKNTYIPSNYSTVHNFGKNRTQINLNKARVDINTQTSIKPKYQTVVKFHNFPQNFPETKKDNYKKINLKDVFSVLKVYKPEFKF